MGEDQKKIEVDAIREVKNLADQVVRSTRSTRQIPAVVTVDVRDVFNSASWEQILITLRRRGFKPYRYLYRIVQQYLQERKLKRMIIQ